MSILEKNILLTSDEDIVLPFTVEWKNVYNFVVKKINETKTTHLIDLLDEFLTILIKDGDTQEDIVLKTAMLYFAARNTHIEMQEIEQKYSQLIVDGVNILLNDSSNTQLDNIFINKKYGYLGKIKLAEYITTLNNLKNKELVEKIKYIAQVENIFKRYKGKTHKKLLNILIQTKNNIK